MQIGQHGGLIGLLMGALCVPISYAMEIAPGTNTVSAGNFEILDHGCGVVDSGYGSMTLNGALLGTVAGSYHDTPCNGGDTISSNGQSMTITSHLGDVAAWVEFWEIDYKTPVAILNLNVEFAYGTALTDWVWWPTQSDPDLVVNDVDAPKLVTSDPTNGWTVTTSPGLTDSLLGHASNGVSVDAYQELTIGEVEDVAVPEWWIEYGPSESKHVSGRRPAVMAVDVASVAVDDGTTLTTESRELGRGEWRVTGMGIGGTLAVSCTTTGAVVPSGLVETLTGPGGQQTQLEDGKSDELNLVLGKGNVFELIRMSSPPNAAGKYTESCTATVTSA